MEVIEHVADPGDFLRDCAQLLAPGGLMIVATLNRTLKAFALAKVGAEYVLRWLPAGTHDWSKFLKPEEIRGFLAHEPFAVDGPFGVVYDPLSGRWTPLADTRRQLHDDGGPRRGLRARLGGWGRWEYPMPSLRVLGHAFRAWRRNKSGPSTSLRRPTSRTCCRARPSACMWAPRRAAFLRHDPGGAQGPHL